MPPIRLTILLYAGALAAFLGAAGHAQDRAAEPKTKHTFTRAALLKRFDADQNGEFDEDETARLRHAFGDIDVPVLPTTKYDYSSVQLPSYIDADLFAQNDNTPQDNPLTDDGATLGRVLFYDRQLSKNGTVACASCHEQRAAFSDPRRQSQGFGGGHTGRNSMSLVNLRFTNVAGRKPGFFWDERAATLEQQVLMPIQDKVEMGMTLDELEQKLGRLPYYPPLFTAAFGSDEISSERIARALAQFVRSIVSFDTEFDRAAQKLPASTDLASMDFEDLSELENLGKSMFMEGPGAVAEFACVMCHVSPTFSMPRAANIGLSLDYKDKGLGALARPSNDLLSPSNDGKFKASSLRNVELTAPYMHDGRFKTLDDAIEHYSRGVHPHDNLGLVFEIRNDGKPTSGFHFTKREKAAMVAFLKTLTDRSLLNDPRFSDPFLRSPSQ